MELNPPFSMFIGNDSERGDNTPLERPPIGRTHLAPEADVSTLPNGGNKQHNVFENPPIGCTQLAQQTRESSLPKTDKDRHNVFENPPIGRTEQDIFEQLVGFTPTDEFLALMELLKTFPDLNKLGPSGRAAGESSTRE